MSARYDKIILVEKNEEKIAVIIYDEKSHLPITYAIVKQGMDDMVELLNK